MGERKGVVRCIVFDFDGVLVDSNTIKRNAYFHIFVPLLTTRPVVEAILEANKNGDRYENIERILHGLVTSGSLNTDDVLGELIESYAEQYNRICEESVATCREIAGASACLTQLARRYALYVNSATPEGPLRRIVQRRGWQEHFRDVLGHPSTKANNLALILDREKVSGREVVFVGDSQQDLDAALHCGCRFVGLVWDASPFHAEPPYTVSTISELQTLISQMQSGLP